MVLQPMPIFSVVPLPQAETVFLGLIQTPIVLILFISLEINLIQYYYLASFCLYPHEMI